MVIDDKAISWLLTILTGAFALWANYRQWRLNEQKEGRNDRADDVQILRDIIAELRIECEKTRQERDELRERLKLLETPNPGGRLTIENQRRD